MERARAQRPKVYMKTFPFKKFRQDRPLIWWKSYTDLKHSFYANIRQATLRRVFSAVSALFVIQIMHLSHRITLLDLGVIKSEGLTRKALLGLLTSPRNIPKKPRTRVWAETEFFEMDLLD